MPTTTRPRTLQDEVQSARRKHNEQQLATIRNVSPMHLSELTQNRDKLKDFWGFLGEIAYEDEETGIDLAPLILHLTEHAFPVLENMLFGDGKISELSQKEKKAYETAEELYNATKGESRFDIEEEIAALEEKIRNLEQEIDYDDLDGTDPEGKLFDQIEALDKQKSELEPLVQPREVDELWGAYLNNRKSVRHFLKVRLKKADQAKRNAAATTLKPLNLRKAALAGQLRKDDAKAKPDESSDTPGGAFTVADCDDFRTPERTESWGMATQTSPWLMQGYVEKAAEGQVGKAIQALQRDFEKERATFEREYAEQAEFDVLEAKCQLEDEYQKERGQLEAGHELIIVAHAESVKLDKKILTTEHAKQMKAKEEECVSALKTGLTALTKRLGASFTARLEKEKAIIKADFEGLLKQTTIKINEAAKQNIATVKEEAQKQIAEKEQTISQAAEVKIKAVKGEAAGELQKTIALKAKELEASSEKAIEAAVAKIQASFAEKEGKTEENAATQIAEARVAFEKSATKQLETELRTIKQESQESLEGSIQEIKVEAQTAIAEAKVEARQQAQQTVKTRETEIKAQAQQQIKTQTAAIKKQEQAATKEKLKVMKTESAEVVKQERAKLEEGHKQQISTLTKDAALDLKDKLAEKDHEIEAMQARHEQDLDKQWENFTEQAERKAEEQQGKLQEQFDADMAGLDKRHGEAMKEALAAQKEELKKESRKAAPITAEIGTSPGLPDALRKQKAAPIMVTTATGASSIVLDGYQFKTPEKGKGSQARREASNGTSLEGEKDRLAVENGERKFGGTPTHFAADGQAWVNGQSQTAASNTDAVIAVAPSSNPGVSVTAALAQGPAGSTETVPPSPVVDGSLVQAPPRKSLPEPSATAPRHIFDTPGRAIMVTGFGAAFISLIATGAVYLSLNPDPMVALSGFMAANPALPGLLAFAFAMAVIGFIGLGMARHENKSRQLARSPFRVTANPNPPLDRDPAEAEHATTKV